LKATYLPQDLCFIAEGGEGTAAWLPPGVEAKPGPLLMARMMSLMLFTAKSGAFKRLDALSTAMGKAHPKEAHYYLFAIGVRTGFQGRGIGKALMKPVLEQADKEGMPCYLESSKESNIPVYRAVGFELSGEIRPAPDAPVLYPMWREPHSA
ncbi:MAG: GNAT family N-acetyltransferase, partial [Alphaproteobacteria bacterium]|nr:GNAT family N-acetyltransferase [Alphaproteobacteria bacterium]